MSDDPDSDPASLAAFAARAGLRGLSAHELEGLAGMAKRVETQVGSIARSTGKQDEPAHVFRVPHNQRDEPPQAPEGVRR